jgi:hypothetical protein
MFTCLPDELDENGVPPLVDDLGVAVPENAICELLNRDNSITAWFQQVDGEWYRYGEAPEVPA